jgi:hypothetical protein
MMMMMMMMMMKMTPTTTTPNVSEVCRTLASYHNTTRLQKPEDLDLNILRSLHNSPACSIYKIFNEMRVGCETDMRYLEDFRPKPI